MTVIGSHRSGLYDRKLLILQCSDETVFTVRTDVMTNVIKAEAPGATKFVKRSAPKRSPFGNEANGSPSHTEATAVSKGNIGRPQSSVLSF